MIEHNLLPCPECNRPAQQPEITFSSKRKPDFSATVRCSRCNYRVEAEGVTEDGAMIRVAKLWGVVVKIYQVSANAQAPPSSEEVTEKAKVYTAEAV